MNCRLLRYRHIESPRTRRGCYSIFACRATAMCPPKGSCSRYSILKAVLQLQSCRSVILIDGDSRRPYNSKGNKRELKKSVLFYAGVISCNSILTFRALVRRSSVAQRAAASKLASMAVSLDFSGSSQLLFPLPNNFRTSYQVLNG